MCFQHEPLPWRPGSLPAKAFSRTIPHVAKPMEPLTVPKWVLYSPYILVVLMLEPGKFWVRESKRPSNKKLNFHWTKGVRLGLLYPRNQWTETGHSPACDEHSFRPSAFSLLNCRWPSLPFVFYMVVVMEASYKYVRHELSRTPILLVPCIIFVHY